MKETVARLIKIGYSEEQAHKLYLSFFVEYELDRLHEFIHVCESLETMD